jgi:signal transduction histidine kinase
MTDNIPILEVSKNDTHSHNRWLKRVRFVWFVLIPVIFVTFLFSIPGTYRMLKTICESPVDQCASWAQPTPQTLETLTNLHISIQTFAIFHTVLYTIVSLVFWASGLLVLRFRSKDWHGLVVSYLLISLGSGGVSLVLQSGLSFIDLPEIVGIVSGIIVLPLYLALSLFFQTFPDGKIYPRWASFGTVLILANYAAWLAPSQLNIQNWNPVLMGIWLLVVFGFHIFVVQGVRYRYYYTQEQRQQTKWLIYGAGISLVISVCSGWFLDPKIGDLIKGIIVALGFYLPITFGVMIAILRYRLWDIDIIINRTLVYGLLSAIVVAMYVLIVGGLGSLLENDSSLLISLLGVGVIAVLFQSFKENIQRAINRLMFGKRDEPMIIMDQLSKGLAATLSQEAALAHLVEATAKTLKLPYVAVEQDEDAPYVSFGHRRGEIILFPLIYQAKIIGHLIVTPRSPGEMLNAADRLVLENVARQASNIVFAARLTSDLQESRQRIVTAREEERRRLRRDLHDGLGPALATLTLQAEVARDLVAVNPKKSEAMLGDIIDGTQTALADIRRVVYALRPPALDDLGLVAAIKEQAAHCSIGNLSVTVEAPEVLPVLPAAVEVAAYRIVQEALTNVTRHAEAYACKVCLRVNGKMEIEVSDDGKGIPLTRRAGVGLSSMHERAAELGGLCVIDSILGEGTQIKVSLPR